MSSISSVGSSESLPTPEPMQEAIDPDEKSSIDFLQDQYVNQLSAIAVEHNL